MGRAVRKIRGSCLGETWALNPPDTCGWGGRRWVHPEHLGDLTCNFLYTYRFWRVSLGRVSRLCAIRALQESSESLFWRFWRRRHHCGFVVGRLLRDIQEIEGQRRHINVPVESMFILLGSNVTRWGSLGLGDGLENTGAEVLATKTRLRPRVEADGPEEGLCGREIGGELVLQF